MRERVAIVTGAGQGIGNAIALRFLEEGMRVTIADLMKRPATRRQRLKHVGDVLYVSTDVAKESQVQEMVAKTLQVWGRLDFLVNNAGIAQSHGPAVTDLSLETWNRVLAVNLTGSFLVQSTPRRTSKHARAALLLTLPPPVHSCRRAILRPSPHPKAV